MQKSQASQAPRPLLWGRCSINVGVVFIVALVVTACLANEQMNAPVQIVVPVPTFTATFAAPAIGATVAAGPTATYSALPAVAASLPETVQPIATILAVTLTPPLIVTTGVTATLYVVQAGDTLGEIAARFQTSVSAIKVANQLTNDTIYPGQSFTIPNGALLAVSTPTEPTDGQTPEQPVVTPTVTVARVGQALKLSILVGDLASVYPATFVTDRLTLHYEPGTIPTDHPQLLAATLTRALAHHEQMLHITFAGRFDAYVAGSPFAPPDQSLRGHSYSAQRYFVFLDDGSGNPDDLTYLAAHELTHMLTWLVFGRPTDPMLSEGAAVYLGMDFIANARHLPITTFCAAYSQVGALPHVSAQLRYQGHIRDLQNYYAGGCFVRYLIETYGTEKFGKLYPSNDYVGIYGKTLKQLDDDWHAAVAATPVTIPFDAAELVQLVDRLEAAHTDLFDTFTGTAEQMDRYRELDPVRMALLEGRLEAVKAYFAGQNGAP